MGECYRRGDRCHSRVVGFSWTQHNPNVYTRFMIRRCIVCGGREAELIHYINPNLPFCTDCGAQDFTTSSGGENQAILTCNGCKKQQLVLLRETQDGNV